MKQKTNKQSIKLKIKYNGNVYVKTKYIQSQ